jgi:uncharacterized protein DUF4440
MLKTTLTMCLALLSVSSESRQSRPQDRSSAEETVRSLDDQERIAALKRDIPSLERLWSDQLTVNAPNNQVVVGKRAVMDTFVRSGIINFLSFERQIEFLRVESDFAIIMGAEIVRPATDAPAAGLVAGQTIRRRFTNIWKREDGTWRLFWRHANVIPSK